MGKAEQCENFVLAKKTQGNKLLRLVGADRLVLHLSLLTEMVVES